MGNYDVKWHAYEQGIKQQASWANLTPEQRATQMGRYAQGLQDEEIKAGKKLFGKKFGKALAQERAGSKTKREIENIFSKKSNVSATDIDQRLGIGKVNPLIEDYQILEARSNYKRNLGEALDGQLNIKYDNKTLEEMSKYYKELEGSSYKHALEEHLHKPTKISADMIDKKFGIGSANTVLDGMNDNYRFLEERSNYKRALGEHLHKPTNISADGINQRLGIGSTNTVLDGMNDNYRFLEERSNYKRALGEHLHKPTNISADMIDKKLGIGEVSPQTEFYRALEESQNANKFKIGKWGKAALIGVGIAAIVGLGIWAAKKIKQNKEEKLQEEQNKQTQVPVDENNGPDNIVVIPPVDDSTSVVPPTVPDDTTVVVPPAVDEEDKVDGTDEADEADKTDETDKADETDKDTITVDGKKYTVKKGDNVWNIAKEHLREELGREPKLSEIKAKEQEIMKENNLKFEADGYVCIIKPEQELKVA